MQHGNRAPSPEHFTSPYERFEQLKSSRHVCLSKISTCQRLDPPQEPPGSGHRNGLVSSQGNDSKCPSIGLYNQEQIADFYGRLELLYLDYRRQNVDLL